MKVLALITVPERRNYVNAGCLRLKVKDNDVKREEMNSNSSYIIHKHSAIVDNTSGQLYIDDGQPEHTSKSS